MTSREQLERMAESDSYGPGTRVWAQERLRELDDQVEIHTEALKRVSGARRVVDHGVTYKAVAWSATEHHEEPSYAQRYAEADAAVRKSLGCKGCGRLNRQAARFCANCGSEVW